MNDIDNSKAVDMLILLGKLKNINKRGLKLLRNARFNILATYDIVNDFYNSIRKDGVTSAWLTVVELSDLMNRHEIDGDFESFLKELIKIHLEKEDINELKMEPQGKFISNIVNFGASSGKKLELYEFGLVYPISTLKLDNGKLLKIYNSFDEKDEDISCFRIEYNQDKFSGYTIKNGVGKFHKCKNMQELSDMVVYIIREKPEISYITYLRGTDIDSLSKGMIDKLSNKEYLDFFRICNIFKLNKRVDLDILENIEKTRFNIRGLIREFIMLRYFETEHRIYLINKIINSNGVTQEKIDDLVDILFVMNRYINIKNGMYKLDKFKDFKDIESLTESLKKIGIENLHSVDKVKILDRTYVGYYVDMHGCLSEHNGIIKII